MSDIAVNPVGLRQVGAAVQSAGSRLAGAVPPAAEATVQPTGGGEGWAAWLALGRAGAAWLGEIRSLSAALVATGDKLTQAAAGYEHADDNSAARLHGARAF